MKSIWIRSTLGAFLLVSTGAMARAQNPPAPDNTKTNRGDRAKTAPTADQGGGSVADRDIMQKIRKAVVDDSSLSTYAHNAKIIARDGKVTLRGPVHSEKEKQVIERKATEVVGVGNVANDLTVVTRPAPKN